MPESVDTLLLTIISILVIIIFWWSIYAFFHAIFLFIFSAWDAEKIKKAWNSIRFMILWILLTLFFLFIFPLIFKKLNLPNYQKFQADAIFRHTGTLLSWLFSFWKEAVNEYNAWWASSNPYIWTSWWTWGSWTSSWWWFTTWGSSWTSWTSSSSWWWLSGWESGWGLEL